MKAKQMWNFIGIILVISLILGVLIHFNTLLIQFGLVSGSVEVNRQGSGISKAFAEVLISSFVAFFTFIINYYLIRPFDSTKQINKRRILMAVFLTIIAVTVLSDLFFTVKHLIFGEPVHLRFNLVYSFRDMFTGIIVIAGIYFIKTVYDKQDVKYENEILKREKLLGQYESLKNKISPHFMFNSLTALRELIDQDPKDAKQYISNLSLVLRYTMNSIESQSKFLYEELEMADSYIQLVKIRFGSNIGVEINIDERYKNFRVPPLSVQTLLENAIKHNEISKTHPLAIKIETSENQSLIVSNPIHEKPYKEYSSGIGLSNLSKQYNYLSGSEIKISKENNEFRVELPLLAPGINEGTNS